MAAAAATPPGILNHQGLIQVNSIPFTGTGSFKFALVNAAGTSTFWSNDGTSTNGSEPTAAISLGVTKGRYAVVLGDTNIANMTSTVPASVFATNSDVRLRIWFNDGTNGSQLLAPDQRLASVGYALHAVEAETIADGSITETDIAAGGIHSLDASDGSPVDALFVDAEGAVGIGVTTPSGSFQIGVVGRDAFKHGASGPHELVSNREMRLNGFDSDGSLDGDALFQLRRNSTQFDETTGTDLVTVNDLGNLGIGETTPDFPLHINADGTSQASYPGATASQQAKVQLFVNQSNVTGGGLAISTEGGFFDLNDGYITYLPLSSGQGLRVQGELKVVDLAWPDYVFEDNYELASLEEVEQHIDTHGHLPDVPSAATVEADGVDLGEMNVILLRKIEEMTLRQIELHKAVTRLQNELTGLKGQRSDRK